MRAQSAQVGERAKYIVRPVQSALPKRQFVNIDDSVQKSEKSLLITQPKRIMSSASTSIATDLLEVTPNKIIFTGININQKQTQFITVRNLSKFVRRIRFQQPKTQNFKIDFDTQKGIAAGLAVKIMVIFQTYGGVEENYYDSFKILSEEGVKVDVELHALKQQPQINYETSIDFGYVQLGKENKKSILFSNEGDCAGSVHLKYETLPIEANPHFFEIQPKQKVLVDLILKAVEVSNFRGSLDVNIDGKQVKKIDLSATIMEFTRLFTDEYGLSCNQIDFGQGYYGKKRVYIGNFLNNTPQGHNFSIRVKQGLINLQDEQISVQTPSELGMELTEKSIQVVPKQGYVGPYQQVKVQVFCQGIVTVKEQMMAKSFCFSSDRTKQINLINDFFYSLIFDLDHKQNQDDTLIVHIIGKNIVPMVKLSRQLLNYGEVNVNENKDILLQIENVHPSLGIDVAFNKVVSIFLKPEKFYLDPCSNIPLVATFTPKNVGYFSNSIDIVLLEGNFSIPLKVIGETNKVAQKRPLTRGPEARVQDFQIDPKFVDYDQLEYLQKRKNELKDIQKDLQKVPQTGIVTGFFIDSQDTKAQHQNEVVTYLRQKPVIEQEQYKFQQDNKKKYSNYLSEQRINRENPQIKPKPKQNKIERRKSVKIDATDDEDNLQFFVSDEQDKKEQNYIDEPELKLPLKKDTLFVVKPIEKYDPIKKPEQLKIDPTQPVRRILSAKPTSHKQGREIHQELNAEDLKKITVGPAKIDFGNTYINCLMKRKFSVKSDLRGSIKCRLIPDIPELQSSFTDPQIIESGQIASFEICLKPKETGQFKHVMKYVINDIHYFDIMIMANVEYVTLEINKIQLKFQFNEDNQKFTTQEVVRLTNPGNGPAQYRWVFGGIQKIFTVNEIEGIVSPQSFVDVLIIYNPSNIMKDVFDKNYDQIFIKQKDNQYRIDEEKIIIKVTDGQDIQIKCTGWILDPKILLKTPIVDLQEVCVCQKKRGIFQLKGTSKSSTIFKVVMDSLPLGCTVTPSEGKLQGEEIKEFQVTYENREERSSLIIQQIFFLEINTDILVQIRSGRVIRIPFSVKSVIPNIFFEQPIFDFGRVTVQGNQGNLPLKIINNSIVDCEIIFDLRNEKKNPEMQEGVQCLYILEGKDQLMKSIIEENEIEQKTQITDIIDQDDDINHFIPNQQVVKENKKFNKQYSVKINSNQIVNFELHLVPREIREYYFKLPVILNNYGLLPGLDRIVTCQGSSPRFLVDPQHLEFNKKILLTPIDRNQPVMKEILLSNPEQGSVAFMIDESMMKEKVFQIVPVRGRVDGGQTLRIKVIFNPKLTGDYEDRVPLYIEENGQISNKPYIQIIISGSAAKPRLLFDRREIILPPVPLNVTTNCVFRIFNDGFQNMKLQVSPIDGFHIEFPEGNYLGLAQQQIPILVTFISSKTISITQILEFIDENQQNYTIPVSATTDNCVFTNYPYLTTQKGLYQMKLSQPYDVVKSSIQLIDKIPDDEDNTDTGSVISKQSKKYGKNSSISQQFDSGYKELLRQTLPQEFCQNELLYKCDHIKRWMNFILPEKITKFPQDIIDSYGQQIFDLISYLTVTGVNKDGIVMRDLRIQQAYQQYNELILTLKSEGALLNHIRPCYLLPYTDYSYWTKINPSNNTHPQMQKISQVRFYTSQTQMLMILIFQILKLFYLPRVSLKQLKNISPQLVVNDNYLNSNVYSVQEMLLLRWIEFSVDYQQSTILNRQTSKSGIDQKSKIENTNKELTQQLQQDRLNQIRLESYCDIFKDGNLLASLALSYLGEYAQKYFASLQTPPRTISNQINNLIKGFVETGIITHFIAEDFKQMGHPETLLLIMNLYTTLPYYIPKSQNIIFQCTLGEQLTKSIELTNPSTKSVIYYVRLDGSTDFVLEDGDTIKIDPKATVKYRVKFTSRVSEEQSARITFSNNKQNEALVSAIVFVLKSHITGRISEKIWSIQSSLYEEREFSIQIQNKFTNCEFAHFQITFQQIKIPIPKTQQQEYQRIKQIKKQTTFGSYKSKEKDENKKEVVFDNKEEAIQSFFCKQENLRLKRGALYNLQMQFIPTVFIQQKCYLIFTDPQVGEFQYEIIGNVDPPELFLDLKLAQQLYVEQPIVYQQHIPVQNDQLKRAQNLIRNLQSEKNTKGSSSLLKKTQDQPNQLNDVQFTVQNDDEDINAPIQSDKTFTLVNYKKTKISTNKEITGTINEKDSPLHTEPDQASDMEQNQLKFSMKFKNPVKDYNQIFTLMNADRTDVRRIRFTVNVLPKPVKSAPQ